MEPVRILHCVVQLNQGGIETLLINLLRNINRNKIQFDFLVSMPGVYDEEIKALGGRIFYTPFITKVGPFIYAKNLRAFFAAHPEYKIVHSHMDKFSGMVVRQAKKMHVPIRIAHSHSTRNDGGLSYQLVKNYYGAKITANATHFFACSKEASAWLFKKKATQAQIIKNGIDLQKFVFNPQAHTAFTIAHIGNFTAPKNHTFLLQVFAEVVLLNPTAQLLLVGSGALQPQTKQQAEQLNIIQNVHFLGAQSNVAEILNKADVFCLPSNFEGLGIALIEAQACGLPCVASTDVPKEADVTGNVQFLPLGNAKQWANALLAYQNSPKQNTHAQIAKAGYDITQVAKTLTQFYLQIAQETHK